MIAVEKVAQSKCCNREIKHPSGNAFYHVCCKCRQPCELVIDEVRLRDTYYIATHRDGMSFEIENLFYAPRGTHYGSEIQHGYISPMATLTTASWPCRLFEVTGKPILGYYDGSTNRCAFEELTVTKEIDPTLVLGPQGREVAKIFARAAEVTEQQGDKISQVMYGTHSGSWWSDALACTWALLLSGDSAGLRVVMECRAFDDSSCPTDVVDAVRGALYATLTREHIAEEQYDLLTAPWRKVIGEITPLTDDEVSEITGWVV